MNGKASLRLLIGALAAGVVALIVALLLWSEGDDAAPSPGPSGRVAGEASEAGAETRATALPLPTPGDQAGATPERTTRTEVEPLAPVTTRQLGQDDSHPRAQELAGRLLSSDGGPIAGATVWCVPPLSMLLARFPRRADVGASLDEFPHASTAGDGRFILSLTESDLGEEPGSPENWPALVGLAEGFEIGALEIVGPSQSVRDLGDLVLGPGTTVHGHVVTEDGTPIAGAWVTPKSGITELDPGAQGDLSGPNDRYVARDFLSRKSTEDGRFAIPGLRVGHITFVAEAGGFEPATLEVDVQGDDRMQELEFTLRRGSRLVVSVRNARDETIHGARVFAAPRAQDAGLDQIQAAQSVHQRLDEARRSGARGIPAADETFIVSGLTESACDVFAEADGYEPGLVQASATPEGSSVAIVLATEAVAHLKVIDESSRQPVLGATVQAWKRETGALFDTQPVSVQPDGEGEFLLSGLGAVKTFLWVCAPGHAACFDSIAGVSAGTTKDHVVALGAEGSIAGEMTTLDSKPLADVTVSATLRPLSMSDPPGDSPRLTAITGPTGRYTIGGVGKGEWQMRATLAKHVAVGGQVRVAMRGETAAWSSVLPAGATIAGTLSLSDGQLLPGTDVSARLIAALTGLEHTGLQSWLHSYTGPNGEFTFGDMAPGTWQIGGERGVTVEAHEGETKRVDVVWPAPPKIVGRVLADGGGPVAAMVIACASESPASFGVAIAQSNGAFELFPRATGEHRVMALCREPMGCTEVVRVSCASGQVAHCDLRVGHCLFSGVCVSDPGSTPVAGARVSLVREGFEQASMTSIDSDGVKITPWPLTDEHGRFEMRIGPGKYVVRASAPGHATTEVPIEVEPGATSATLDLVLSHESG